MKVLLVKPWFPYPYSKGEYTYNRIFPPLALANCAALLEDEGCEVAIVDAGAEKIKLPKLKKIAEEFDKIFITSSSLDKWQCPNIDITPFLDTVKCIKDVNSELYLIGYHGTVDPEAILEQTQAKAVIIGEPEYSVRDICRKGELASVKGICYKDEEGVAITEAQEQVDLKKLPIPAFHLLDFGRYSYEILGSRLCLFEINRGCRLNCSFCNKIMYGEGLRTKAKEQIFREVSLAVEKYKVATAYFMDLDFLSDREIASELCDYLIKKKYKLKWVCQTRPDLLDIEIVKKMKEAGCRIIHLGVEAGSQELLDSVNKGVTVDKIRAAFKMCKTVGLQTLAFCLFGLPGETDAQRRKTFNFIKKLDPDFVSFHKLTPYKGSTIGNGEYQRQDKVDRFIAKAMLKYYLRPVYLFRLNPYMISCGLRLMWGRIKSLQ